MEHGRQMLFYFSVNRREVALSLRAIQAAGLQDSAPVILPFIRYLLPQGLLFLHILPIIIPSRYVEVQWRHMMPPVLLR